MSHAAIDYSRYQTLQITRRGVGDSVLDIQMKTGTNGKLPTAGHDGHRELTEIWRDVGADDSVRCAVLRGEGMGFSGGGDLALVQDMANDFTVRTRVWKEARDLVYNVINCSKPVVSAILSYEYQSSDFGVLLPKKFSVVSYRFSGKGEKDLVRTKSATKTFEYSKFSKPDSEIKETKIGN